MNRTIRTLLLLGIAISSDFTLSAYDKNVPRIAATEIARRGPLAERINNIEHIQGIQDGGDATSAFALAMQPPADDSHKWLFTLVTTKNCSWCDQLRRDFATDPKLKAWVDTKDYTQSWAHWQVVQIEDQSQAWRWKDFRPASFPTLIVQPPVNGSWGDPHTIVFVRQGYLKPAELDTAIRQAIQQYAAKLYPRHRAWSQNKPTHQSTGQAPAASQIAQRDDHSGGWTPPVTPPTPLSPVPLTPNSVNLPAQYPPLQPDVISLLVQLVGGILGGPALANLLLVAILAWQVYRGIAKREGIPLLIDDNTAQQLTNAVKGLPRSTKPGSSANKS